MLNGAGRDKDSRSWGKLNDNLEVPQDKVSPKSWIKLAKRRNGAPTKREVSGINVVKAACMWAKIKCDTCEHAVEEVLLEARIHFEEGAKVFNIISV